MAMVVLAEGGWFGSSSPPPNGSELVELHARRGLREGCSPSRANGGDLRGLQGLGGAPDDGRLAMDGVGHGLRAMWLGDLRERLAKCAERRFMALRHRHFPPSVRGGPLHLGVRVVSGVAVHRVLPNHTLGSEDGGEGLWEALEVRAADGGLGTGGGRYGLYWPRRGPGPGDRRAAPVQEE